MLDFTLEMYARLAQAIAALGWPVFTVRAYLLAGQPAGKGLILRHDVDRNLAAARRMARLEAELGLAATYYFRHTPAVFRAEALRQIAGMGHEIGYHYEVLARTRGDLAAGAALFARELAHFRQILPVETASFHGSPLRPWANQAVWAALPAGALGLLGEASLTLDFGRLYYFTDTGRTWGPTPFNIRDHVPARRPPHPVRSTPELIAFLQGEADGPVVVSAHPNRWAHHLPAFCATFLADWAANWGKWLLARAYQLRGG